MRSATYIMAKTDEFLPNQFESIFQGRPLIPATFEVTVNIHQVAPPLMHLYEVLERSPRRIFQELIHELLDSAFCGQVRATVIFGVNFSTCCLEGHHFKRFLGVWLYFP